MKKFIIFLSGAAVGSFCTYLYLDKKHEEYLNEISSELDDILAKQKLSSLKEEVKETTEDILEEAKETASEVINSNKYFSEALKPSMEEVVRLAKEKEEHIEEMINDIPEEVDINEDGQLDIIEKHYGLKEGVEDVETYEDPYLIDYDTFLESEYDSQTLTYYVDNRAVVDEAHGEIMPEAFDSDIIGEEILSKIEDSEDSDNEDGDVYYVRNERLKIDYEIIKSYEDYKNDILNED